MTVVEAQQRLTYREFLVRLEWKAIKEEHPTLDQWYLMQIAREVACVLHPKAQDVKIDHFKLKATKEEPKREPNPKKNGVVSGWLKRVGL